MLQYACVRKDWVRRLQVERVFPTEAIWNLRREAICKRITSHNVIVPN
jgi:hypothetical protein